MTPAGNTNPPIAQSPPCCGALQQTVTDGAGHWAHSASGRALKKKAQHTQRTRVPPPQRMPRLLRCPHSPAAHPARPAGTSDNAGSQVDDARALRVRLDVVIAAHRARTVMRMCEIKGSAEQDFAYQKTTGRLGNRTMGPASQAAQACACSL